MTTNSQFQPFSSPGANQFTITNGGSVPVNVYSDDSGFTLLGTCAANSTLVVNDQVIIYLQSTTPNSLVTVTATALDSFGLSAVVATAGGTIVLTPAQYNNSVIELTGSPGSGFTVTFPAVQGAVWDVANLTGQTATLTVAGQTSPPTLATVKHARVYYSPNQTNPGIALLTAAN